MHLDHVLSSLLPGIILFRDKCQLFLITCVTRTKLMLCDNAAQLLVAADSDILPGILVLTFRLLRVFFHLCQ